MRAEPLNTRAYEELSRRDLIGLFEIIDTCAECRTEDELAAIVERLHELILFEDASLTLVDKKALLSGKGKAFELFTTGFPDEFIDTYFEKNFALLDVPLNAYFRTGEIQVYSESIKKYNDNIYNEFEIFSRDFGYYDGFVYGVGDLSGEEETIICVNCGKIETDERSRFIIKTITSFLSESYKRVLRHQERQKFKLTGRELEVLSWIKEGKTSWEISKILKTSKRTVDFHTYNLIEKLDAANRTNAVAIAMGHGLIKL